MTIKQAKIGFKLVENKYHKQFKNKKRGKQKTKKSKRIKNQNRSFIFDYKMSKALK